MDDFEVEVVGARRPHKADGLLARMFGTGSRLVGVLLMHPQALAFIGVTAFVLSVGTPHVGWDYSCRYRTRPGEPCRSVSYCAYYGIQGRRVVFPEYGESCKLITLLPLDWQRIM